MHPFSYISPCTNRIYRERAFALNRCYSDDHLFKSIDVFVLDDSFELKVITPLAHLYFAGIMTLLRKTCLLIYPPHTLHSHTMVARVVTVRMCSMFVLRFCVRRYLSLCTCGTVAKENRIWSPFEYSETTAHKRVFILHAPHLCSVIEIRVIKRTVYNLMLVRSLQRVGGVPTPRSRTNRRHAHGHAV